MTTGLIVKVNSLSNYGSKRTYFASGPLRELVEFVIYTQGMIKRGACRASKNKGVDRNISGLRSRSVIKIIPKSNRLVVTPSSFPKFREISP